jgi:hypothetical protein
MTTDTNAAATAADLSADTAPKARLGAMVTATELWS